MPKQHAEQTPLFLEKTEGDGNCAFNAFVLGFCEKSVLDAMVPPTPDFVQKVNVAFNQPPEQVWEQLKAFLIELRVSDKLRLQKELAKVMRATAIDCLETKVQADAIQKEAEKEQFSELLSADFDAFKTKGERLPVFESHTFINDKFTEISLMADQHAAKQALEEWWNTVGYHRFYAEKDANLSAFLGAYDNFKARKHDDDMFRTHENIFQKYQEVQAMPEEQAYNVLINWWTNEGGRQLFFNKMSQSAVWGGDLELMALGENLGVNINLYSPGNKDSHGRPLEIRSLGSDTAACRPTMTLIHQGGHWSNMRSFNPLQDDLKKVLEANVLEADEFHLVEAKSDDSFNVTKITKDNIGDHIEYRLDNTDKPIYVDKESQIALDSKYAMELLKKESGSGKDGKKIIEELKELENSYSYRSKI